MSIIYNSPAPVPQILVAPATDERYPCWVPAAQHPDDLVAAVNVAIRSEWTILDYEGFEPVDMEHACSEDLGMIALLARGIAAHGRPFAAWADALGLLDLSRGDWQTALPDATEDFADVYQGAYNDLESFGRQHCDRMGLLAGVPESLIDYIDFGRYADDMHGAGEIAVIEDDGMTLVFRTDAPDLMAIPAADEPRGVLPMTTTNEPTELADLRAAFDHNGGRGVDDADRIDALAAAEHRPRFVTVGDLMAKLAKADPRDAVSTYIGTLTLGGGESVSVEQYYWLNDVTINDEGLGVCHIEIDSSDPADTREI